MNLSLLDFNRVDFTIDFICEADRLGFHRYWLGEHHSEWQCSSPLLLGALLAASTQGIRLGSGGICLDYQSPFRIAEEARLIEFLLPGRFDLGVTRGMPLSEDLREALGDNPAATQRRCYFEKLADLHGFLTNRIPEHHPLHNQPLPLIVGPPLWILGASRETALWAAERGTGFCCSLHHVRSFELVSQRLEDYRNHFLASPEFPDPAVILVVSMICAATRKEAVKLEESFMDLQPAAAQRGVGAKSVGRIVGSATDCAEKIQELANRIGVDEVMVLDLTPSSLEQRVDAYEAICNHLRLPSRTLEAEGI